MKMTRLYVNAIIEDTPTGEVVRPIGQPDARLEVVQKRVQRRPRHGTGFAGHYDDVVIAYRDVPQWTVLKGEA